MGKVNDCECEDLAEYDDGTMSCNGCGRIFMVCAGCSESGGAGMPVYHAPPLCGPPEQRLRAAERAWAAAGYPPDGPILDERDDAIGARLAELPTAPPGQRYAVTDDGDLVLCEDVVPAL